MTTLEMIFLASAVSAFLIGVLILLIGGIIFENGLCIKIGIILFIVSILCMFAGALTSGAKGKKATIKEEKFIKIIETKKEPVIDTTIVIKNGVADTTFTYKFRG